MHLILKKEPKHTRLNTDITAFIEKQPSNIRRILNKIRPVILNSSSRIHESMKHKIPFYSYKGFLCYINPATDKVIIGFCQGAEFANDDKFLIGTGKTIRHAVYKNVKDVKISKLQHLMYEALIINEIISSKPKRKKILHPYSIR